MRDGLRHGLGPRHGRSAGPARAVTDADREYFELEFVVGFSADDETFL